MFRFHAGLGITGVSNPVLKIETAKRDGREGPETSLTWDPRTPLSTLNQVQAPSETSSIGAIAEVEP